MGSWRPIGVARKQKRSQTSMVGAMKMPGISLSASKRVLDPDRQVSWLRIVATGLLPKAAASVDLVHGSPVTVTGSRRIRTGFPFQLSSSHLSASLLVEALAGITSPKR
jgi:hypothetical protein